MTEDKPEVVYRINAHDILISFNKEWDIFAAENHSPAMHSEKVGHTSIWAYIHDFETKHIHETLLTRVRADRQLWQLPFRCDSPEMRRFMEMDIIHVGQGTVEYRCRTLHTEKRQPLPPSPHAVQPQGPFLRMCSWCKKMDGGHDAWLEIEDAVVALDLLGRDTLPPISHTMCDHCLATLESKT